MSDDQSVPFQRSISAWARVPLFELPTAQQSEPDAQVTPPNESLSVALVLGEIAGHDPSDSTSLATPVPDYTARLDGDVRGMRIGVPREYFGAGIDPGVEEQSVAHPPSATQSFVAPVAVSANTIEIILPVPGVTLVAPRAMTSKQKERTVAWLDQVAKPWLQFIVEEENEESEVAHA